MPDPLTQAVQQLLDAVRGYGSCVVAFSGGVDSAVVAQAAQVALGGRAVAATGIGPAVSADELATARKIAGEIGIRHVELATSEIDRPGYVANATDRCYHCKEALGRALGPVASAGGAVVVLGVNLDDLGEHRPGQRSAAERGARFPLVEAGFTKAMVRDASRHLGLRTADKPAAACLASRVPYGTPVTLGVLREVEEAEAGLKALGFGELRVRHYRDMARIEVPVDRMADLVAQRDAVVAAVRAAGYRYVTVDLEGLRSGNLNAALADLGTAVSS